MDHVIERVPGKGWLALLGGGEFSFGETEAADLAWLRKAFPNVEVQLDAEGEPLAGTPSDAMDDAGAEPVPESDAIPTVGFVPVAAASSEYGAHFAVYLDEYFDVGCETVPIYRARDARRGKNVERLAAHFAVYLGGGATDHLLDAIAGSPAYETLRARLHDGGVVAAIAAAAQSCGRVARSVFGGQVVDGLALLPNAAIEPNFAANAPEIRRLQQMLRHPEVQVGLGLGAGAALLLGPSGEAEIVGDVWRLDGPDSTPRKLS
ncbi:MAG: Type 1 glutamine amidotransferase-like domain-containing protein [Acidobacteriota bacterium]